MIGEKRFEGAGVLVTGAARGIGLAVARRFVAEGAAVWLADIDEQVGEVAAAIGASAGVRCDVRDPAAVEALVEAVIERHGRLDVAVANAGVGGGAPLIEMTDGAFRGILAVNLDGVFFTCRAAAKAMTPQGSGAIITVGSVFGRDTPAGAGAYGASKAGVVALTQALARELAPLGIRANCVCPGHIETELYRAALRRRGVATERSEDEMAEEERGPIPLGRFGSGEDVAGVVAFLASADAGYVTGQAINVDGGLQPR
ncbi:MAG: hypothetical protein QOJ59_2476 [Thermomicrobiales bacterium]|nr:hypothetical protein [Thermomicrobiales bacterium]